MSSDSLIGCEKHEHIAFDKTNILHQVLISYLLMLLSIREYKCISLLELFPTVHVVESSLFFLVGYLQTSLLCCGHFFLFFYSHCALFIDQHFCCLVFYLSCTYYIVYCSSLVWVCSVYSGPCSWGGHRGYCYHIRFF